MIQDKLRLVPKRPGCYQMKDKYGSIIYVGKAKNLFNRLHSYFNGRVTGKTKLLVSDIVDFEYIVTSSEKEAFILEINLIKNLDPKYNILLKDDKSYPYIEITNEKYPRVLVKREINITKKHKLLFGPYPNAYAARRLVNLINRIYPLKKCDRMPKKECLYYHIGECLGYCINKDANTSDIIKEISSILNGNSSILINRIKEKIEVHSNNLNYEQALSLKEELNYMNVIFEKQKVELNDGVNRDVFSYYVKNFYICYVVLFLRNGKLVGQDYSIKPIIGEISEMIEYYIVDFYSKKNIVPKELIIPDICDSNLLSDILDTKVISVKRGIKYKLYLMALDNAKIKLNNKIELINKSYDRSINASISLGKTLGIDDFSVVEIFDNSNLFGSFTVSGMVVFIDGVPSKKDYRKFKLSFDKNDDVKAMKEVIYRRYFRLLKEGKRFPDLIIVDGAYNQISACIEVLNDLRINIAVCGLKKDEHHSFTSLIDGRDYSEVYIDKQSDLFYLLNKMSDEVHRYTITYHKNIRSKGALSSVLDNVKGIGENRKKKLINKFGSISNIKNASFKELNTVLPSNVSKDLYNYFKDLK
ncbi:MAG: excinuclease ABC subunit UvrC [Bacilli bacterium]